MIQGVLEFLKFSGAGNDFIVGDNRDGAWSLQPPGELAQRICRRGVSVGADGLILIENSKRARFKMAHYNPDGSESGLCGNGARCAARFAFMCVIAGREMTMETGIGVLNARVLPDARVRVELPTMPRPVRRMTLALSGREITGYRIDTGVPHFVLFVRDIERAPLAVLGPKVRMHPDLGPEGANVDFVESRPGGGIYRMRTYERGVEAETLACGTGAMAVARVLGYLDARLRTVSLMARSGRMLWVEMDGDGDDARFALTGDATVVYRGKLARESLEE